LAATLGAALSKEVGLAVAPVALLLAWWGSEQQGIARLREMAWRLAPVAVGTALYFALRMQALHGLAATGQHRDYGAFAYLFGLPVVLVDYLGLQFWPLGTAYLYAPIRVPEGLPLAWWLDVALVLLYGAGLVVLARRRAWLAVTGLVLLVVAQLPSMAFHLVRVPGGETALPFASRWLYLPSLGLGFVAAEVMGSSSRVSGVSATSGRSPRITSGPLPSMRRMALSCARAAGSRPWGMRAAKGMVAPRAAPMLARAAPRSVPRRPQARASARSGSSA
jgi:hypothetical protein